MTPDRPSPRLAPALAALTGLALGLGAAAHAPDPDPARFVPALAAFEREDARRAVPAGPVVFVGSSSIRYWDTAARFPSLPVVNRGLAGAHLSDLIRWVRETVLRHAPSVVVVYAGDNDVADGKSAARVEADYRRYVESVRAAVPGARIVYLPIKPSLARWAHWPAMRAANERIRRFSAGYDHLHYVELTPAMLDAGGRPRPELLAADGLHLSDAGYRVWSGALAALLADLRRARGTR